ncbi:hypothetical protein Thimo_2195 [Thioflavicoccus mobilis 8321]|uniref:Transposase IS200-like domain-containing protein n=1 Tax=Thioflavicoccus mobilis 8321 TaxID=765912 RepID=L0GVY9_9GAMM|nr:hypothetical protein Thimo_2195 [Thioflavicoccus mobilis 8321]
MAPLSDSSFPVLGTTSARAEMHARTSIGVTGTAERSSPCLPRFVSASTGGHAYCPMSNHYHLLMANLSAGMRQLNGVYTGLQRFTRTRISRIVRAAEEAKGKT